MDLLLFIVPMLFIAVGLLVLAAGARPWRAARRSGRWPGVDGLIIKSQVKLQDVSTDGNLDPLPSANIVYLYAVAGRPYQGHRVTLGPIQLWSVKRMVTRYPKGMVCRVFHHPRQPARAVLLHGLRAGHWVLPLLGLSFVLIGLFAILLTQFD